MHIMSFSCKSQQNLFEVQLFQSVVKVLWRIISFFFSFIFISRRLITLQHCSVFCHTLTWISHGVTWAHFILPSPDVPLKDFLLHTPHPCDFFQTTSNLFPSSLFPFLQRDEAQIKYITLVISGPFLHLLPSLNSVCRRKCQVEEIPEVGRHGGEERSNKKKNCAASVLYM